MKWQVETSSTKTEDNAGGALRVELPSGFDLLGPAPGQTFEVLVRATRKTDKETDAAAADSAPARRLACRFVADGRSLQIGSEIVRLGAKVTKLKGERVRQAIGAFLQERETLIEPVRPIRVKVAKGLPGGGDVKSPMTGKILKVAVKVGDAVAEGDLLFVIEAMKMENRILAEGAGAVATLRASEGQAVTIGELLCTLKAPPENSGA